MLGFEYPDLHPCLVALVAAKAATCGRLILARLAQRIVLSRWANSSMKDNLAVDTEMTDRRRATSGLAFLALAFSPLPSKFLFIAYSFTRAPLWLVTIPFFY